MENPNLISTKRLALLLRSSVSAITYHLAIGNLPQPVGEFRKRGLEMFFDKQEVAKALGVDNLDEGFMSMSEAAVFFGITHDALLALCNHDYLPLPYYRLSDQTGSRHLFLRSELEAYKQQEKAFLVKEHHHRPEYKLNYLLEVFERCLNSANLDERSIDIMKSYFVNGADVVDLATKHELTNERTRQLIVKGRQSISQRFKEISNFEEIANTLIDRISYLETENKLLADKLGEKLSTSAKSVKIILIKDLDLSLKARRCLKHFGITTLNALCEFEARELLSFRTFGKQALSEVRLIMRYFNLKLKNE